LSDHSQGGWRTKKKIRPSPPGKGGGGGGGENKKKMKRKEGTLTHHGIVRWKKVSSSIPRKKNNVVLRLLRVPKDKEREAYDLAKMIKKIKTCSNSSRNSIRGEKRPLR